MRFLRLACGTLAAVACAVVLARAQVGEVRTVAPDVYFHEGDIKGKGHCNNGWVVFQDYVLVIDANFPSGAREIIPKIRALTQKPIRFAFDTHHHGDHAYGNQVWVDEGATPVAHTGVLEEMKKYETALFGGGPGRWEDTAKQREDVRTSKLKAPTVLFPDTLIFDDGVHRVELHHFGVGPHSRGRLRLAAQGEDPLHRGCLRERTVELRRRRQYRRMDPDARPRAGTRGPDGGARARPARRRDCARGPAALLQGALPGGDGGGQGQESGPGPGGRPGA